MSANLAITKAQEKNLEKDALAIESWLFGQVRAGVCTIPAHVVRAIDRLAFEAPLPGETKHNIWALSEQYQRNFRKEEGRVDGIDGILQELPINVQGS